MHSTCVCFTVVAQADIGMEENHELRSRLREERETSDDSAIIGKLELEKIHVSCST